MVHFKQKSTGQKFKMASLSAKRSIKLNSGKSHTVYSQQFEHQVNRNFGVSNYFSLPFDFALILSQKYYSLTRTFASLTRSYDNIRPLEHWFGYVSN